MRKLGLAGLAATGFILLTALPAFAGSEVQPPNVGGEVVHPPGAGVSGGATAFTGGNVQVWMVLAVGLLVIGAALLIAGRRRGANAAR